MKKNSFEKRGRGGEVVRSLANPYLGITAKKLKKGQKGGGKKSNEEGGAFEFATWGREKQMGKITTQINSGASTGGGGKGKTISSINNKEKKKLRGGRERPTLKLTSVT